MSTSWNDKVINGNAESRSHFFSYMGTELHHIIQKEPGGMVEIIATTHDEYTKILHGLVENGNSFRNNPETSKQFTNFMSKYWRWRATEL